VRIRVLVCSRSSERTHFSSSGARAQVVSLFAGSSIEIMATHPTDPMELYTALLNTGLDGLDTAGSLQVIGTLTGVAPLGETNS
jgi:hypothetical protein